MDDWTQYLTAYQSGDPPESIRAAVMDAATHYANLRCGLDGATAYVVGLRAEDRLHKRAGRIVCLLDELALEVVCCAEEYVRAQALNPALGPAPKLRPRHQLRLLSDLRAVLTPEKRDLRQSELQLRLGEAFDAWLLTQPEELIEPLVIALNPRPGTSWDLPTKDRVHEMFDALMMQTGLEEPDLVARLANLLDAFEDRNRAVFGHEAEAARLPEPSGGELFDVHRQIHPFLMELDSARFEAHARRGDWIGESGVLLREDDNTAVMIRVVDRTHASMSVVPHNMEALALLGSLRLGERILVECAALVPTLAVCTIARLGPVAVRNPHARIVWGLGIRLHLASDESGEATSPSGKAP